MGGSSFSSKSFKKPLRLSYVKASFPAALTLMRYAQRLSNIHASMDATFALRHWIYTKGNQGERCRNMLARRLVRD